MNYHTTWKFTNYPPGYHIEDIKSLPIYIHTYRHVCICIGHQLWCIKFVLVTPNGLEDVLIAAATLAL